MYLNNICCISQWDLLYISMGYVLYLNKICYTSQQDLLYISMGFAVYHNRISYVSEENLLHISTRCAGSERMMWSYAMGNNAQHTASPQMVGHFTHSQSPCLRTFSIITPSYMDCYYASAREEMSLSHGTEDEHSIYIQHSQFTAFKMTCALNKTATSKYLYESQRI